MNNMTPTEKIAAFFRESPEDYWKTIDEVADATRLDPTGVRDVLTNSGDYVRSSYRTKNGESLYTSREMYRTKAPFVDKLIGAFKNRID